jgi:GntR family histidine utilization transcriptional repressor
MKKMNLRPASHRRPAVLSSQAAPLYEKVKRYVVDKIGSGEWATSGRLPGEPELARSLGISRMTINRALRELAEQRILERIPGVGTFVAEAKPTSALVEIHNIADEIRNRGQTYGCEVVVLEKIDPPRLVLAGMDMRPGDKAFRAVIVHRANGSAAQLEERYVRPSFAPRFLDQDFTRITTTAYLFGIQPPSNAEHVIEAEVPDEETQRLLEIWPHEPCLVVSRRTWVGSMITTYSRLTHPGSRYRLIGRTNKNGDTAS